MAANASRLPVVGIVAHRIKPKGASRHLDGQYPDYCPSVIGAGGVPVLIPLGLEPAGLRSIYERLDGVLFSGGPDVAPTRYGQEPHPALGEVDAALDEIEIELAHWALADARPVLAICRGIQLLNVAAGGTLHQDIPALLPGSLAHACPDQPDAHAVEIAPGSALHAALGASSCMTNSRHHQALRDVAPGMVVSARTSDGIIEGIELAGARFIVGVQWHPENLVASSAPMRGLFRAFVDACRKLSIAPPPSPAAR